jgi:hypothetical protein
LAVGGIRVRLMRNLGSIPDKDRRLLSFHSFQTCTGTHPTGDSFFPGRRGGTRPRREADNSPPSSKSEAIPVTGLGGL